MYIATASFILLLQDSYKVMSSVNVVEMSRVLSTPCSMLISISGQKEVETLEKTHWLLVLGGRVLVPYLRITSG